MAALWKLALVLLSVGLFITLSSSEEAGSDGEDALIISDFAARAKPGWIACNYTETPGASCYDCHTRLICSRIGGFVIPCWWPGSNHCVHGECETAPSEDCAPSTTTSTSTTESLEPTTESSTAFV